MTRILSDGGDRIWEIRDMETAGFLKKEAVHASFSLRRIHFTPTENAEHLWNEASIVFKVPSIQSTFSLFFRSNTYIFSGRRRKKGEFIFSSHLSFKFHVFKKLFTDYSAIHKL